MKTLPKARNTNLVEQVLGNETLVYDLVSDRAICLNPVSSIIWQHCDGQTELELLISKFGISEEIVEIGIDQLNKHGLLADQVDTSLPVARSERRKFLRKVGAASLVGLPLINTIVAPNSLMAQSCIANGATFPHPLTPGINTGSLAACQSFCNGFVTTNPCCSGSATLPGIWNSQTGSCFCGASGQCVVT